jgi:phospholipid N-methyltransferase
MHDIIEFLQQFLANPFTVGAVCSSSSKLSEEIVDQANITESNAVVELGPGTGAFTQKIVETIPHASKFFTIENNPYFADKMNEKFPDVDTYADCAGNIDQYLEKHGVSECDTIISGIPWTSFNEDYQRELLYEISNALSNNGKFLTIAYAYSRLVPTGKKFKGLLSDFFSNIEVSSIIWRNVPPVYVYSCTK